MVTGHKINGSALYLALAFVVLLMQGCGVPSDTRRHVSPGAEEAALREIKPDSSDYIYEVNFIDAGQGDAILVLTPSFTMLVDAGPRDAGVAGYLRSRGITGFDLVIATHPHADHIGGMPEVFRSFDVNEVIDPGVVHTTVTYEKYLNTIDELNITYTVGRAGMKRDLGDGAVAEFLHPSFPDEGSLNDASVVIRLLLGNVSILLTGDIERKSEEELLVGAAPLQSDILKVPHHGSPTSSHHSFLESVNPRTAIIMCGQFNPYGNPHQETLALLSAIGAEVYRTDLHGHIRVRSDGDTYIIETIRDSLPQSFCININTATFEELQNIIHIGPARARQIINLRPFGSLDDLLKLDGIGPARLREIKRQNIAVTRCEEEEIN